MITNKFKIALLLSYICIASISAAIITPALPAIKQSFGLTHGALEWVISIFLLGYVMGQLIYGPIANRFGGLIALRSGLAINIIGILLCIMAVKMPNYNLLLLGRLVTALGAASGLSCTFMLLNKLLSPERVKLAMSFTIVSFTIGIGIAVVLGGLITQYLNWEDTFLFLLAHGIIMLLLTWIYQKSPTKRITLHPKVILIGYLNALKNNRLVIFSLTAALVSAFAYGYSAAAPIFAQKSLHLSPSEYAYWNLMNMVGMLGSGFLSAFLMKKYDAKYILFLGFGLMVPALISLFFISLVAHATSIWFFTTTMMLYLLTGFLFPTASYFASNAIMDKASASSMMSFINIGAAMLSVVILGYLPLSSILSFTIILSAFFFLVIILVSKYFLNNKNQ